MKLILAHNGNIEYDVSEELYEAEIECMLDRLVSSLSDNERVSPINDNDLIRALQDSPWERGLRAC